MNEPAEGFFKIRPAFVLWFLAGLGWLLIITGFVLWWGLPRWVPEVVVVESPWLGPAFEAVLHKGNRSKFMARLPEWGESVVPTMCSIAASGGETKRRLLALDALSWMKDPREIPLLLPLLKDPDDDIVKNTLYALWNHKDPKLAQPLFDLLPHLAPDRAHQAAQILSNIPNAISFDVVSTALLDARRVDLQYLGCIVLIGSSDPRTITALVERLGRLTDGKVDYAGYALGQSRIPGVTEAIATALMDPDPQRRLGAVVAVQWHRSFPNHAALLEPLLRLTTDPEADIQVQVMRALAGYPNESAVAALRAAIDAGGALALIATENLSGNRSPVAIPTMIACLGHPEVAVRRKLLSRLRYKVLPATTDQRSFLALLHDHDPEVVKLAKGIAKKLKLTPDEQRELDAVK